MFILLSKLFSFSLFNLAWNDKLQSNEKLPKSTFSATIDLWILFNNNNNFM